LIVPGLTVARAREIQRGYFTSISRPAPGA
jgi:hypothetical protein